MRKRENSWYQHRDDSEMTNENPLSADSSALTAFDDDKLIHRSNQVFNNAFNGQSNGGIFICSQSLGMSQWDVSFSPQVDIIHQRRRERERDFLCWEERVIM